jgi:hypothetical protein
MHPYWAGYRSPRSRQIGILVLSALAGVIVSGAYMWVAIPRHEPAPRVRGNVVRPVLSPEENASILVTALLFFGTIYATGMALYRYFGDTEGYTVVSATAGQHLPLVFLVAGGALVGVHSARAFGGHGRVSDWLMLPFGLGLLAISAWGLYRALVVHRTFYRWFYGSRK